MRDGVSGESAKRVLMAKTGLDGHWRGPTLVLLPGDIVVFSVRVMLIRKAPRCCY